MKKLGLQIEKLRVDQFEVHPESPVARKTVHGFEADSWYSYSEPVRCLCVPVAESLHPPCL